MTLIDRGTNMTYLQSSLLRKMDAQDSTHLVNKAKELFEKLPSPFGPPTTGQGLLLGLIQSGKTAALTTAIALAADNGYKLFVVLTSDNLLLYQQTIDRLNEDLQGLQIAGKDHWADQIPSMMLSLRSPENAVVLVATKNSTVLTNLLDVLAKLQRRLNHELPAALLIDDEADQASLDTQKSRRAANPNIEPGRINDLITQIRDRFPLHVYLQVTATPQALFLQELNHPYRPEFTILIEPGKGYIGGQTFFSLVSGQSTQLIRRIEQPDVDTLIATNGAAIPDSLKTAICIFYVGATLKYLLAPLDEKDTAKFSFLCHISEKKADHNSARLAIESYCTGLREGLGLPNNDNRRIAIEADLKSAYQDLCQTLQGDFPSFEEVIQELQRFIIGTSTQILNSDRKDQPQYSRRYNIFIGGTKLARGVTIKNLIVTYYGREPITANMDTMLQHARMYGYREKHLDVTRLFVTEDIERRFRLINESEHSLRQVIIQYPNEIYRGIFIGRGVRATRRNVLDPNNAGAYGAGSSYFPYLPVYHQSEAIEMTRYLDEQIKVIAPDPQPQEPRRILIDQAINLIKMTKSHPGAGGLWDDTRIVTALETIKDEFDNTAYLIVRRNVDVQRNPRTGVIESILTGGEQARATRFDSTKPILFMFRLTGSRQKNWDDTSFWVPTLRFPDGQYGIMFNFD